MVSCKAHILVSLTGLESSNLSFAICKVNSEVQNMSEETEVVNKSKEKFTFAVKEIVLSVLSLIILSAVGYVFSSFNTRLTTVEQNSLSTMSRVQKIELVMELELRNAIEDLTDEMAKTSGDLTISTTNQRSLQRSVDRLEIIVGRL